MRRLADISCLEASPTDAALRDGESCILFHGYGADAYDLRSLAEVLSPGKNLNFLFPQGILEVPIGPDWTGRAWWPIDLEAIQSGKIRDFASERPESLDQLRKKIFAMVDALKTPWNKIHIGGFSQGAMLATDIFLNAPEAPKSLIILSGALINKTEWKTLAPNRAGSKFFMSHGQYDPVLPHKGAAQLETLLIQSGLKGSLQSFAGGHEIPMPIIEKLRLFF